MIAADGLEPGPSLQPGHTQALLSFSLSVFTLSLWLSDSVLCSPDLELFSRLFQSIVGASFSRNSHVQMKM